MKQTRKLSRKSLDNIFKALHLIEAISIESNITSEILNDISTDEPEVKELEEFVTAFTQLTYANSNLLTVRSRLDQIKSSFFNGDIEFKE